MATKNYEHGHPPARNSEPNPSAFAAPASLSPRPVFLAGIIAVRRHGYPSRHHGTMADPSGSDWGNLVMT